RAPDDPDPELPEPQPQPRTVAVDRRAQQQLVTYGQQLDGSAHGISHAGRSNGLRPGSVAEDPGAGSVVTGCASSRGTPAWTRSSIPRPRPARWPAPRRGTTARRPSTPPTTRARTPRSGARTRR